MLRPLLRMGDPRLLARAEEVRDPTAPEIAELLADMRETMLAHDGVGLAAPQIGVGLRVVLFGFDSSPRYPDADAIPETVLINPILTPLSAEEEEGWEGCLSVPGLRGSVPRFTHLRYTGVDAAGRPIDRSVSGFHARVVQHECDHLDGILYPMRVRNLRLFGFEQELVASGIIGTASD